MNKYRMISFMATIALWLAAAMGSPDFRMIGYATTNGGTTGGAGGAAKTISTLQQLVEWGKSREKNTTPEIVTISGKITGSGDATLITIKNGANITIQGKGSTGELVGAGLNIRDYTNVIIKNLTIHEVLYPDDALTLDNVQRCWVDHCELYSKIGNGITVDTYDGLLDIKKGSSAITISWCFLHDHMKCSLIGHTDNTKQQATDSKITVTYHHNRFINTDGRNPSLRFGTAHLFNNYYGNITDYGLAARDGGHAKIENCHYDNVKLPMSTDKFPVDDLPNGYICQNGNLFTGDCGEKVISQDGCGFWNSSTLPYSYTLDDAATVKATVQRYAGVEEQRVAIDRVAPASNAAIRGRDLVTVYVHGASRPRSAGTLYDFTGRKLGDRMRPCRSTATGIVIVRNSDGP